MSVIQSPFIEFKHVTKKFGEFKALDDVSLSIPKGNFMTLLGPSGCGKTTLMRQLAGFSEPDEGEIFLDEKKVNGLPPYKRNTPLVFQEYALFPHMTVFQNISYGLTISKTSKEDTRKRVDEMLAMFNLTGMEDRFPKQLSGGQQQRVAFARALIMGQQVLLLDEPLSNLDAKLRVDVRTDLRKIQQQLGITVIYVTHDQDEALSMSDRIAVMRTGKIEQIGTPLEIYFHPKSKFVADFVGTVNFLDAVTDDPGTAIWQGQRIPFISKEPFQKNENVIIIIRPECISIKPDTDNQPGISGVVDFHSFLGRFIRYWVKTGDGKTIIVDDPNPALSGALNGKVKLVLSTEKIHILKA